MDDIDVTNFSTCHAINFLCYDIPVYCGETIHTQIKNIKSDIELKSGILHIYKKILFCNIYSVILYSLNLYIVYIKRILFFLNSNIDFLLINLRYMQFWIINIINIINIPYLFLVVII